MEVLNIYPLAKLEQDKINHPEHYEPLPQGEGFEIIPGTPHYIVSKENPLSSKTPL